MWLVQAGMGDVDDELVVMGEVRRALGDWDNWAAGRVMAGGSDIGVLRVLAIGHTFTMGEPGTGSTCSPSPPSAPRHSSTATSA